MASWEIQERTPEQAARGVSPVTLVLTPDEVSTLAEKDGKVHLTVTVPISQPVVELTVVVRG